MKNVSITKWETLARKNTIEAPVNGLEDVKMSVKYALSLTEMLQFVEDVVALCVDMDTMDYKPEVLEFAIKAETVTMYTNFNTPTDTGKFYDLIYRTDVVDQIIGLINDEQYYEIRMAIDSKIKHLLRVMESQNAMKAEMVLDRVNAVSDQFESVFNGIDFNEVNNALGSIHKIGNLSEREIASAVLSEVKREPVFDARPVEATSVTDISADENVMLV